MSYMLFSLQHSSPRTLAVMQGALQDKDEFLGTVKTLCQLQDRMKELASQRKALNDQVKELKPGIMEFMLQNNVKRCMYNTDDVFVSKRVATGSLTKASLKQALDGYFGEETHSAEEAFDYVIKELGTREVVELKRAKRKAPASDKPAKKQNLLEDELA